MVCGWGIDCCERFPRLFRVARNKQALVQNNYRVDGPNILWNVEFRRELRSFEKESYDELLGHLGDFRWHWGRKTRWYGRVMPLELIRSSMVDVATCYTTVEWFDVAPLFNLEKPGTSTSSDLCMVCGEGENSYKNGS